MNNNIEGFKKYLTEIEIGMEELKDDESIFFRTTQKLKNSGQSIGVAISFINDSDIVDVEIFNYVSFNLSFAPSKSLLL